MDYFHHIGLHVDVNLKGKVVGGVPFESDNWVTGVIVGMGAVGHSLTVELDEEVGGGKPHGVLRRPASGQRLISVQPEQLRAKELSEVAPGGIPDDIVQLARAGKTVQAIKKYRALNGATFEEAQIAISKL
jgi:hypothetical protein